MSQGNIGICWVITEEELSVLLNNPPVNFQTGKNLTFQPQREAILEIEHNMKGHDIDGKMYYIEDTGDVTIKISHEPIMEEFDLSDGMVKRSNNAIKKIQLEDTIEGAKGYLFTIEDMILIYNIEHPNYELMVRIASKIRVLIIEVSNLKKLPRITKNQRETLLTSKEKLQECCYYARSLINSAQK